MSDKKILLGLRIKQVREEKGLKQEYVRFKVGISQAALSKIEHGENMPKLHTLMKIADALGVNLNDLLPPSVANDILGTNSLFGSLWFRIRMWWYKRR